MKLLRSFPVHWAFAGLWLAFFGGCANTTEEAEASAAEPPGMTSLVGTLPGFVGQHPLGTELENEFYFDVDDGDPDSWNQVIVTHPSGMNIPEQEGRRIELTGRIKRIDLGGLPGTKNSYKNDVFHLESWKYLD